MRNIILFSLSISLIACEEQSAMTDNDVVQVENGEITDTQLQETNFGKVHNFDRDEHPFQQYITDRLDDLGTSQVPSLEDLEPTDVPVDARCVYGGELSGRVHWELDEVIDWDINLLDQNDLYIQDIEHLVQLTANAQDLSPMDLITDGQWTFTLHQEYVDIEVELDQNDQVELTGEWFICPHYD